MAGQASEDAQYDRKSDITTPEHLDARETIEEDHGNKARNGASEAINSGEKEGLVR